MAAELPQQKLDQFQQEQLAYKEACEMARWEDLTAEKFPLTVATHARPFYFTRLGLITNEEKTISDSAMAAGEEKGSLAILRGRMKELTKAASETIALLYPHVTPAEEEKVTLTPEAFAKIEDFVNVGAIEQLNEDNIPGWDSLSVDQRLLYRLKGLQVYNADWHGVEEDDSLDENESIGFAHQTGQDTTTPRIKEVTHLVKQKIVDRHLKMWLGEALEQGLTEENPLVQQVQKMVGTSQN